MIQRAIYNPDGKRTTMRLHQRHWDAVYFISLREGMHWLSWIQQQLRDCPRGAPRAKWMRKRIEYCAKLSA